MSAQEKRKEGDGPDRKGAWSVVREKRRKEKKMRRANEIQLKNSMKIKTCQAVNR